MKLSSVEDVLGSIALIALIGATAVFAAGVTDVAAVVVAAVRSLVI